MIVQFIQAGRILVSVVMDAVPRSGEGVDIGGDAMVVWNVAWRLEPPTAYVELVTKTEYDRAGMRR